MFFLGEYRIRFARAMSLPDVHIKEFNILCANIMGYTILLNTWDVFIAENLQVTPSRIIGALSYKDCSAISRVPFCGPALMWMNTLFIVDEDRHYNLGALLMKRLFRKFNIDHILVSAMKHVYNGYYQNCSKYDVTQIKAVQFRSFTTFSKKQAGNADIFFTLYNLEGIKMSLACCEHISWR